MKIKIDNDELKNIIINYLKKKVNIEIYENNISFNYDDIYNKVTCNITIKENIE